MNLYKQTFANLHFFDDWLEYSLDRITQNKRYNIFVCTFNYRLGDYKLYEANLIIIVENIKDMWENVLNKSSI